MFKKLLGAAVKIAVLPIDVAADIVTINDGKGSHTVRRIKHAYRDIDDMAEGRD